MAGINDIPIRGADDDLLKIVPFSNALVKFVSSCDTPITIGLQGEWGTGKTSLMGILRESLETHSVATSWVNAWEYSMFAHAQVVTPKVLNAMMMQLEEECKKRNLWTVGDDVGAKIKKVGRFFGAVANQVMQEQTGVNVQNAVESELGKSSASEIAELKSQISDVIERLINDGRNPFDRVVFFLDDLDRIPPSTAVSLLEALKNIFDIPYCVFVLAIDYDVIVKGLESKFGKRTDKNEREFRSFFDKIIQVPFTMPTASYDISAFLQSKFERIDFIIDDQSINDYTDVVRLTVGTNPRGLKRFLNSLSLIAYVREHQPTEDEEQTSRNETEKYLLFALIAIQISFPKIFRLLTQDENYIEWDKAFGMKQEVEWDAMEKTIGQYGENELLDEPWEKIIWAICQRDPHLKAKTFDIILLLNKLRETYGDNLQEKMIDAMELAAITNVDSSDAKSNAKPKFAKTQYESLDSKLADMEVELGCSKEGLENFRTLFAPFWQASEEHEYFKCSLARTGSSFNDYRAEKRGDRQLVYTANPGKRGSGGFKIYIKQASGFVDRTKTMLMDMCDEKDESNKMLWEIMGDGDLIMHSRLAAHLGVDSYQRLLGDIAKLLVENRSTVSFD